MINNNSRLFVPLPMNPLHRHVNKDSTQSTTSVTKEMNLTHTSSSGLHRVSSSGRTKNLPSQPNLTSDFTIIEIIKPDNQKHEGFIPAFAQLPMIQDSSLESSTLMNLKPLKTSFFQRERVSSSSQSFSSYPFQSVPSHQPPPQSAISSSSGQQSPHEDSKSSFTSETDYTPDSPIIPLPISALSKLKVVFWVNELRRYLFLWETRRMNNTHAAELHQLLCKIEDKMADPFLTPQMLGETSLGRVMKSFTHGALDAKLKEVARHVVGYWRKVCLEA